MLYPFSCRVVLFCFVLLFQSSLQGLLHGQNGGAVKPLDNSTTLKCSNGICHVTHYGTPLPLDAGISNCKKTNIATKEKNNNIQLIAFYVSCDTMVWSNLADLSRVFVAAPF